MDHNLTRSLASHLLPSIVFTLHYLFGQNNLLETNVLRIPLLVVWIVGREIAIL